MVAFTCNLCLFIPIYYAFVHVKSQFILSVMLYHTSLKLEAFPLVSQLCSCWLCVVLITHPPPKWYISDLSVTFL